MGRKVLSPALMLDLGLILAHHLVSAAAVEGRLGAAVDWPSDPADALPTLDRLNWPRGAPPPVCPPHCVPPIPSAPNCTFVLAGRTAPGIDEYNRTGHYLCAPKPDKDNGQLVLFLTGTQPSDQTLAMQAVASFGYHALALSYNNFGAPNGQCDVSYPTNQSISDPLCEYNVEQARLWGGNLSAALWARRLTPSNPKGNPYSLVNATNSIMNRLDKALRFAAEHRTAGSGKWARFLATTPSNATNAGSTIAWSKVVLSGWSRGSAYPIHISKFFAVPRVVLFCGLEDYVGMRGPDSVPEPWIAGMPSKVPRSAIWGIGGTHGGCCSNWMRNWGSGAGGLNLHGQGYADFENGSVVSQSAAGVAAVLKGSRRVYLQGPKVGHGTPIYDQALPRYRATGIPVYLPVWEYLFTSQAALGSELPENASCCCAPSHYYPKDFTGPRGCNATACRHR